MRKKENECKGYNERKKKENEMMNYQKMRNSSTPIRSGIFELLESVDN